MRKIIFYLSVIAIMVLMSSHVMANTTTSIKDIDILVSRGRVQIEKSETQNFEYEYDNKKFIVISSVKDDKINIIVSYVWNANLTYEDKVIIRVPDRQFNSVNIESRQAAVSILDWIDAEHQIVNNQGAMTFAISEDITKEATYISNQGSTSVGIIESADNYTLLLTVAQSAVSVSSEILDSFEDTNMLNGSNFNFNVGDFKFVKGSGNAKLSFDIRQSAFSLGFIESVEDLYSF